MLTIRGKSWKQALRKLKKEVKSLQKAGVTNPVVRVTIPTKTDAASLTSAIAGKPLEDNTIVEVGPVEDENESAVS